MRGRKARRRAPDRRTRHDSESATPGETQRQLPEQAFARAEGLRGPAYLVRCHNFSSEPQEQAEIKCKLNFYFGVWPVSVLFFGIVPKDWDDLAERVQSFLTQYAVKRTS
jgi:hypothetical protein